MTLRFDYDRDGDAFRSGLRFKGVRAYRFRSDIHCTADLIAFFDKLVEIRSSEWLVELIAAMPDDLKSSARSAHHYAIYIDSTGCFEVIASAWEKMKEEMGAWP